MVAYDLDRAVRDPRDLEDLIDAKVFFGFDVHSTTSNLRSDTDSDVAMANKSPADTEQGNWPAISLPGPRRRRKEIVDRQLLRGVSTNNNLASDSVFFVTAARQDHREVA